jgi:hypothetical protein
MREASAGAVEGPAPTRPRRFVPPSGTDPGDAPWQAELASWSQDLQATWDEKAGVLEFDAGLDRDAAERRAFELVSGRRAPAPRDEMLELLRQVRSREVDPTELDAFAVVPTPDEATMPLP